MPRFPWRRNGEADDPTEALTAAARLVADDRMLEAIELLTAANRDHRDGRIARRLVELRSEAFLQMSWPEEPPDWPATVPDRFPGALVPEIAGSELTLDDLRSAIRHHGTLLVRGLVDQERVAMLIDDVDRALGGYDAQVDGATRPDVEGWYEVFDRVGVSDKQKRAMRKRGSVLTVESPPAMFDLVETFELVGLSRLVREYFGEPPTLLARKATLRRISHQGTSGGWHQDGAFMGVDIRSLNVWLALSHCGDDAPGLDVVARRLTGLVQTGDGAFADWATSPDAAADAAAGALVRPIFEPGDALIFDHLNLHRTAIDPGMRHDRYAIETWFFSPSTYGGMTTDVGDGASPRDQIPILF